MPQHVLDSQQVLPQPPVIPTGTSFRQNWRVLSRALAIRVEGSSSQPHQSGSPGAPAPSATKTEHKGLHPFMPNGR